MKTFIPNHKFKDAASVVAITFCLGIPGSAEGVCACGVATLSQQAKQVEYVKPLPVVFAFSHSPCVSTLRVSKRPLPSSRWQPRPNPSLLAAVRSNNVRACKRSLDQGADPNAQDNQGRTALMLAAAQNETSIIRLLLAHGADVFLKSRGGHTALTYAVQEHHPLLVKTLIASVPSNEMLPDPASLPVMALAAIMNDSATVRELLHQGAKPKGQDCTLALTMAAEFGREDIVEVLLTAGVDVNHSLGPEGTTILMVASQPPFPGQGEIVEALIKAGANVKAQDAKGKTALMYAATSGSLETMKVLLAHGADAAVKDKKGETAAQIAAIVGGNNDQAIASLLARAVSGTQDTGKRLGLVAAVEHGDAATLQDLLSKGADVNARDDAGETLLMKAAKEGQLDLVNLLLKYKADVKVKSLDYWGYTALVRAAEAGHADVVKALLEAGSDPNAKIAQGFTVLTRTIHVGSDQGAVAVADALLRHGANPNGKDDLGETELIETATYGATAIAKLLLDHGGLINARDTSGNTALWRAVNNGWPDMVDLLVQRGADVNLPGEDDEKPLKVAYERGANLNAEGTANYRRIVATLKKAGAHQ